MKILPLLTIRAGAAEAVAAPEMLVGKPGVFALEVEGEVTHLSTTGNLGRRAARVAKAVGQTDRNVFIHCWRTFSKLGSSLLLYDLAREYFPATYHERLHLRMPWFVAMLAQDKFPRLAIGNRLLTGANATIGPFPSRDAAQLFEERVQAAFSLRRCTETLRPSPNHPGCLYGEIKQCLRPCQDAVSISEYNGEAALAASFLHDGGRRTLPALVTIRGQAAEAMDFEAAAKLHKQIERLREAIAVRNLVTTDISAFRGIAVVPGVEEQVQLFPIVEGLWQPAITVSFAEATGDRNSLEQLLRSHLDQARSTTEDDIGAQRLEHLALFSRWYYSSWRQGEWLPFTSPDQVPYRKLLRTIPKLVRKLNEDKSKAETLSCMLG